MSIPNRNQSYNLYQSTTQAIRTFTGTVGTTLRQQCQATIGRISAVAVAIAPPVAAISTVACVGGGAVGATALYGDIVGDTSAAMLGAVASWTAVATLGAALNAVFAPGDTGAGEVPLFQPGLNVVDEDLKEYPLKYLEDVGQRLEKYNEFPKVLVLGSPSVDEGGVRRQFLSQLLSLTFTEDKTGHLLRDLKVDQQNKEPTEHLGALGRIMARCYEKDNSLVTGHIYPEKVYRFIKALLANNQVSDKKLVELYLKKEGYSLAVVQMLDDTRYSLVSPTDKDYEQLYYFPLEEGDGVFELKDGQTPIDATRTWCGVRANRKDLFDTLLRNARSDSWIHSVQSIAQGVKAGLKPASLDAIRRGSPKDLQTAIEGVLDKRSIIQAIAIEEGERNANGISYLKEWINSASAEKLEELLFAWTGSKQLAVSSRLLIGIYRHLPTDSVPIAHTCIPRLDLPSEYSSKEVFKGHLDYLIQAANEGDGFQFA